MSNIIKIKTCELVTDGLQTRRELDSEAVADYAENYRNGVAMPPVSVVQDPETGEHYLVDGFHRMAASVQAGLTELDAEVVAEGDGTEALKLALKANQTNGQRRTNADKHAAVEIAWANREALFGTDKPSARKIADMCGVSNVFVSNLFDNGVLTVNTRKSADKDSPEDRAVKKLLKEGKDRFGQMIPEKINPAFHTAPLKKIVRTLGEVYNAAMKLFDAHEPCMAKVPQQGFLDIKNAKRHFKFGEAYCVCPKCRGNGCFRCNELGWLNKEQYDRLPPEQKPKAK